MFEFTLFEGNDGFGILARNVPRSDGTPGMPDFVAIYDLNNRILWSPFSNDIQTGEKLFGRYLSEQPELWGRAIEKGMTYTSTKLKTASGYVIYIRDEMYSDGGMASIYAQVFKQKELVFSLTWIMGYGGPEELEFSVIEGEDDLVAVKEDAYAHAVVALYDFRNHEAWPFDRESGQPLLERLNKTRMKRSEPLLKLFDE
jgi:hypothetical protein